MDPRESPGLGQIQGALAVVAEGTDPGASGHLDPGLGVHHRDMRFDMRLHTIRVLHAGSGGAPLPGVFLMASASAVMLCGYEILRSVSASLFIEAYGTANLPLVMAGSPIGLLALVYVYGRLLSRVGASRALVATSALSTAVLLACFLGLRAGSRASTAVLYIFREGYVVLLIEQYWSFINSVLTPDQARKVNGPVVGLSSLGSVLGGVLVHRLAAGLGSHALVAVGAVSLLPAALLSVLAYRLGGEPRPAPAEAGGRQGQIGLRVLLRSRLLLAILGMIWLTQVVATVYELRFNSLVAEARPLADERSAYLGGFYATLNGIAAAMQFLVAPLALRFLSLRVIHVAIPLVHIATGIFLLVRSSLWSGGAALLLFKALDYSVFRAAKEIFYLPLSFDARYRSKQLIDAFGYRFSKATTSGMIALATRASGAIPATAFPLAAMVASALWSALAARLSAHGAGASGAGPARTESPVSSS